MKDGRGASNELTYLLLEVARRVKTIQPPLYLRCHKGTPEELWLKAAEANRDRRDGVPALLNGEPTLLNYALMGVPIQEARDCIAVDCAWPYITHAGPSANPIIIINQAKTLELTLNNGVDPRTGKQLGPATGDRRDFSWFNELYNASTKGGHYAYIKIVNK